ncbi:MAG: hypothetical protein WCR54_06465 [Clostridia bacterium]
MLHTKKIVLMALLGVSLNAFKFVLMYIPNVEVITLLIVVYTYVFGLNIGMVATLVFCTLEGLLFGFNPSWLLAYFIHWPTICLVAAFLKKIKVTNPIIIGICITAITALFGLQSTFTYFLLGKAIGRPNWVRNYWLLYLSGGVFYIVQCVSALLSIIFVFNPLYTLLTKLGKKYFNRPQNNL